MPGPHDNQTPASRRGHRRRRLLPVAVTITAVALVATSGAALLDLTSRISVVDLGTRGAGPVIPDHEEGVDLVLVGSDGRLGQGTDDDVEGARNDVTMLLHVTADHRSATVVSFPRDLLVDFPDCEGPSTGETVPGESRRQLNEALGIGGLGCVTRVVESLTGRSVPYAAQTSFRGVVAIADAVGGVPVCFSGPVDDPDSGLSIPDAGTYDIQGEQALQLLRSRHGVGDGSDIARIRSQQLYMTSLASTVHSRATLTDPVAAFRLAQVVLDNSVLSTELGDVAALASVGGALADVPVEAISFVTYPWLPDGNRLLPDEDGAQVLRLRLGDEESGPSPRMTAPGRAETAPADVDAEAEDEADVDADADAQATPGGDQDASCVVPF